MLSFFSKLNKILKLRFVSAMSLFAVLSLGTTSCEDSFIFENDEDCHPGINLRFVYDYHMEKDANAFPANVDCVTVYVLDMEDNYIGKFFSETTDVLRDESYRMHIPLDEGSYRLLVYGGMSCNHSTFSFSPDWQYDTRALGHRDDIRVTLPVNEKGISDKKLHDIDERWGGLFYGYLNVTITEADWQSVPDCRTETVYLMKDTNTIQVILQELSQPDQMNHEDYIFQIIDDNFVLDGYNRIVKTATDTYQPLYTPYEQETKTMGTIQVGDHNGDQVVEDYTKILKVAFAEFATSRLHVDNLDTARLVVYTHKEHNEDGSPKEIINIPLITYLLMTKGFGNNWIRPNDVLAERHPDANNTDQQFLDRQSNWSLIFFLQRNKWVKTHIVVNNWTVRVNDIEL